MQNAVLTYWCEGEAPKFFDLKGGAAVLSYAGGELTIMPAPDESGTLSGGVNDANGVVGNIYYADDICSIRIYGAQEPVVFERFQQIPASAGNPITAWPREPNSRPTGSPPIILSGEHILENGDTLWIGKFAIRFIQNSRYLQYLPAPFHTQNDGLDMTPYFTGRFLNVFESLLDPIALMLAQIEYYFSPQTAPESILPYLASWFDLDMPVSLPVARQRAVLKQAVEINRWRSTRDGLSMHIRAASGIEPEISEWYASSDHGPIPIGAKWYASFDEIPKASAGELPDWMRQRGSIKAPDGAEMGCFSILLRLASNESEENRSIEHLIHIVDTIARMHRPVHSAYEIWVQTPTAERPIRKVPRAGDQP